MQKKIYLVIEQFSGCVSKANAFSSEDARDKFFLKRIKEEGFPSENKYYDAVDNGASKIEFYKEECILK